MHGLDQGWPHWEQSQSFTFFLLFASLVWILFTIIALNGKLKFLEEENDRLKRDYLLLSEEKESLYEGDDVRTQEP